MTEYFSKIINNFLKMRVQEKKLQFLSYDGINTKILTLVKAFIEKETKSQFMSSRLDAFYKK